MRKKLFGYANNKSYITKEVKTVINKKKMALKKKDRVGVAAAQRELNGMLKMAGEKHCVGLEECVSSMDSKGFGIL